MLALETALTMAIASTELAIVSLGGVVVSAMNIRALTTAITAESVSMDNVCVITHTAVIVVKFNNALDFALVMVIV